jgi:hypothetical protein
MASGSSSQHPILGVNFERIDTSFLLLDLLKSYIYPYVQSQDGSTEAILACKQILDRAITEVIRYFKFPQYDCPDVLNVDVTKHLRVSMQSNLPAYVLVLIGYLHRKPLFAG